MNAVLQDTPVPNALTAPTPHAEALTGSHPMPANDPLPDTPVLEVRGLDIKLPSGGDRRLAVQGASFTL